MELTIEECVDDLKWDDFISKSPHSSVYITSRILNQSKNSSYLKPILHSKDDKKTPYYI